MTRGYFVLEQSGAVVKAAYLSSDAYLQYGHGQEIIKAYAEGNEMELLEELHKRTDIREIDHIRPGWVSGNGIFLEKMILSKNLVMS